MNSILKKPIGASGVIRGILMLLAFGLVALGLSMFARDQPELNREKRLRGERSALDARIAEVQQQVAATEPLIPVEQDRVAGAEKVIRQLEQLQSTWDMVIGNRAQQKANAERLERVKGLHAAAVARVAELQQQQAQAQRTKEGYEIERTKVDAQLRMEEASKEGALSQLHRGWLRVRPWLAIVTGIAVMALTLWPIARMRQRAAGRAPDGNIGES